MRARDDAGAGKSQSLARASQFWRRVTGPGRNRNRLEHGPGIVGDFGTDHLPHFTVAGRASLHASELERLSGDYGTSILVAESTRASAETDFAFLEVHVEPQTGNQQPLFALLGTPVSRANPKFLALNAFHERILQAYRAGEWEKARGLIEQCRGLSGANPVLYDFYLKRLSHLESHPPSANWGGRLEPTPV
jgi:adenylate cyclase